MSTWHETAIARTKDVPVRLGLAVFITAVATYLMGGWAPFAWLGATTVMQLASLAISEPMRRDPGLRVSARRAWAFHLMLGASAVVFASVGALFWLQGGSVGPLCALLILTGGAMSVAMQARTSARQLWIGCSPFMLLLAALPIADAIEARGPEQIAMALVSVTALLFVGHLAANGRRSVEAARAVRQALFEAKSDRLRAEAANNAKSDFLAVMSHELRTPLNGVLGMAQVMDTDELTPRQRQRLEVVRKSGEALLMLVNDLLDISQIEASTLRLNEALLDLPELLRQIEAIFEPLAQAKGIGFRVRIMESAGVARMGDPIRVRQVLHNVVANAVKFTEAGRVAVLVSGSVDELVFDITDTGPGIPEERLGTIFERFTQNDGSVSRRYGGSGLGLAISRGLARLMGGDISATSKVGEGTVFTVRLALKRAEAPAILPTPIVPDAAPLRIPAPPHAVAAREPTPAVAPAPVEAPPMLHTPVPAPPPADEGEFCIRILAAEDNPTNQLVLKTLLEQIGISIHVVENGEEAVAAWRASSWDLMLMDIQMPVMDGLTATRTIRGLEAADGRPRTPIIAVTANATANQAAEYVNAGMDGLVPKPIQFAQLIAAISGAVAAENDDGAEAAANDQSHVA